MAIQRLSVLVLIVGLMNAPVWAQEPGAASAGSRAKAAFATGESFTEVDMNAYFGYKEANAEAFKKLETNVAALNEPAFQQKIQQAEQECIGKGCKYTVPPFSHVAKEWKKVQKHMTAEEANYAVMGVAVGTVEFYYKNAAKLIPALRQHMISAGMLSTNEAEQACAATQGCPETVRTALNELNTNFDKNTPERAAQLVNVIRESMR
jgi:hypothetical protein